MAERDTGTGTASSGPSRNPGDELDPGTDSDQTHKPTRDSARAATDAEGDVASGGGEQQT